MSQTDRDEVADRRIERPWRTSRAEPRMPGLAGLALFAPGGVPSAAERPTGLGNAPLLIQVIGIAVRSGRGDGSSFGGSHGEGPFFPQITNRRGYFLVLRHWRRCAVFLPT